MHLILVGLPGAGKTTVGAEVAHRLGWSFLDFDAEITRREGASVSEIFAAKGEPYFRNLERTLTEELVTRRPTVISPGGGWITSAGNVKLVQDTATLVYLCVSPETAVARLGSDVAARPLLRTDPLSAMNRLFAERRSAYEMADVVVDSELLSRQRVVDSIVALMSPSGNGDLDAPSGGRT